MTFVFVDAVKFNVCILHIHLIHLTISEINVSSLCCSVHLIYTASFITHFLLQTELARLWSLIIVVLLDRMRLCHNLGRVNSLRKKTSSCEFGWYKNQSHATMNTYSSGIWYLPRPVDHASHKYSIDHGISLPVSRVGPPTTSRRPHPFGVQELSSTSHFSLLVSI